MKLKVYLPLTLILSACNKPIAYTTSPNQEQLFTTKWTNQVGRGSVSKKDSKIGLAESGNNIISSDFTGRVRALDLGTGTFTNKHKLPKPVAVGPITWKKNIIYVGTDGSINKLNEDFSVAWEYQTNSDVLSQPAVNDDQIIIHTLDSSVIALSQETGKKLWQYHHSLPSLVSRRSSSPVVHENSVIVGLSNGKLISFNKDNGSIQWQYDLAKRSLKSKLLDVATTPVIAGEYVVASSISGQLAALSLTSGRPIWELPIAADVGLLKQGDDIISVSGNKLHKIELKTGKVLWNKEHSSKTTLTGSVIFKNKLLLSNVIGDLQIHNLESGDKIAEQNIINKTYITPIVINNQLFAYGTSGQLLALELADLES